MRVVATLGAVIAMLVTAAINYSLQRDFAQELAESLRVKRQAPLGEEEIAKMLRERQDKENGGSNLPSRCKKSAYSLIDREKGKKK